MGQYYRILLKSAEFDIFSPIKVQWNPVNSRNHEKHPVSGPKWPEHIMVKIMKFVKNGENSHFWSLNQPGVARRRGTQIPKHMWKASKIPLLSRYRKDFLVFWSTNHCLCRKNPFLGDFWPFSVIFGFELMPAGASLCCVFQGAISKISDFLIWKLHFWSNCDFLGTISKISEFQTWNHGVGYVSLANIARLG